MSKIDEFIEILELHPSQITDVLIEELGLSGIFYPKPTILEDFKGMLEQLRPHVELAELVYENQDTLYIKNYDTKQKYDECIYLIEQQIKEQK
jgi:hypothetical protein